jgi:hypothetical protein
LRLGSALVNRFGLSCGPLRSKSRCIDLPTIEKREIAGGGIAALLRQR